MRSQIGNDNDELFVADESAGMTAYTFAERVKSKISDLGVGVLDRPVLEKDHEGVISHLRSGEYFDGKLPTVIRKLDLDQISALYSLYTNWFGYLTTHFGLVGAEKAEAAAQREFILNHLKNHYRRPTRDGRKIPETAVTDAAKTDIRYIEANAKCEEVTALYNILEAFREVASQNMKVISREVTIKQEKVRQEMLLMGFGNRGRSPDYSSTLEGYSHEPPPTQTAASFKATPRVQPKVPQPPGRQTILRNRTPSIHK
jgi:hypothetical protein